MMGPAEPYPVRSIEIMQVVRTTALAGRGTEDNPSRIVEQYWLLEGKLLFKKDPHREGE